ncbi:nuclear factor 7, brain-like isoform X2 [Hypanus sabinus]|uniref:nuclear factor 7, brain-like isoform X2 n=1 Tax=Hypanus sabinus TaxID=79690 RepID=UPI0028C38BC6|nr:nuclear factor 7, brain-like isoform X2 [Hypanus sabinus]
MASKHQVESLTEEAICPICLDFFTDPVTLECGHNFCRSCITRRWETEERNSCPECRELFADSTLRVNRALANLAEKARNLNLNPKGKESKLHCEEHEEELKLFCETDKTLICVICRDAEEHTEHRFKPIKEAVKMCTDQLKSSLDSLTKMKSDLQEKEQQQEEKISGVREQSNSVQTHITSQFAKLRQVITEKEQSLLRDLREEEERILNPMEKNLHAIQEDRRLIQEEISKLKEQMDQKDSVMFLKAESHRNRSFNDKLQNLSVRDEAQPFEKFNHPYLLNTVLRETPDAINQDALSHRPAAPGGYDSVCVGRGKAPAWILGRSLDPSDVSQRTTPEFRPHIGLWICPSISKHSQSCRRIPSRNLDCSFPRMLPGLLSSSSVLNVLLSPSISRSRPRNSQPVSATKWLGSSRMQVG